MSEQVFQNVMSIVLVVCLMAPMYYSQNNYEYEDYAGSEIDKTNGPTERSPTDSVNSMSPIAYDYYYSEEDDTNTAISEGLYADYDYTTGELKDENPTIGPSDGLVPGVNTSESSSNDYNSTEDTNTTSSVSEGFSDNSTTSDYTPDGMDTTVGSNQEPTDGSASPEAVETDRTDMPGEITNDPNPITGVGPKPSEPSTKDKSGSGWIWYLVLFFIALVLIIAFIGLFCFCKNSKKSSEVKQNQPNVMASTDVETAPTAPPKVDKPESSLSVKTVRSN